MRSLRSGENAIVEGHELKIVITCESSSPQADMDVSAFLLGQDLKVRHDQDFIFYNQPKSIDGAVTLELSGEGKNFFEVNLDTVPDDVTKIVFVISHEEALQQTNVLKVELGGQFVFQPDTQGMLEKSLNLSELYRHKGNWKYRAIGQGYQGGLGPLAAGYGVDIEDEPEPVSESKSSSLPLQKEKQTESQPVRSVTEPPVNPIPLQKTSIDLRKQGEKATISLAKGKSITAKLKWDTQSDLDLYCFFVDKQGNEDKVYYRKKGHLNKPPYILLHGDSQDAGEEVLEICNPENIKYALIAAYSALSNGVGSFYSYKARVIVSDGDKQEVTSHLAHKDPFSYWVAFSLIDFTQSASVSIENVETYSNKRTFWRQFEERTGAKKSTFFKKTDASVMGVNAYDPERSPHLFADGSFMMSVGVREFK